MISFTKNGSLKEIRFPESAQYCLKLSQLDLRLTILFSESVYFTKKITSKRGLKSMDNGG